MEVDAEAGPPATAHRGRRYLFCSEPCREKFSASPGDYLDTIDPVCGMTVHRADARGVAEHAGKRFFFCSERCKERFDASPGGFTGGLPAPGRHPAPHPPAAGEGSRYTCPMHPEVLRDAPGDCPACGMALEPMMPAADAAPNPELADFRRRLRIGAPLGFAVLVLEMGGHLGAPFAEWLGPRLDVWLQLLLATPVVAWVAAPFFRRGWSSIVHRSPNMWTLIALGAGAAYAFSVTAVLAPGLFPESVRGPHGLPPVYFESAAVILVLVLVGQVLELAARERTGDAIRALLDLAPKTARRLTETGGGEDAGDEEVPLEAVAAGDRLRVRPGESVPVDGVVLDGRSTVDESMITGEPEPAAKAAGDQVTGGTLNRSGSFVMRAETVGAETVLARIVAMVAAAQRSRAPVQALADRVAAWFVPAVIAVAAGAFAAWLAFGPAPVLAHAVVAAVSVLVIACPCALGLATPMSIMAAAGRGARAGVLVRDAAALQGLARAEVLVVDKTGTLTEGKPGLTDVIALDGAVMDEAEILSLAASLERASEHPLAEALAAGAAARGVRLEEVTDFEALVGRGIRGRVAGRSAAFGNRALMDELGIEPREGGIGGAGADAGTSADAGADAGAGMGDAAIRSASERLEGEGKTVTFLAVEGRLQGLVAAADRIRPAAPGAVETLRASALRIVMATGDGPRTARAVARALGIDDCRAQMRPEDKRALVTGLQARGLCVAVAGDGVNDAPALAAADAGIAMGTGADVAVESAGVTLVRGDLAGIVRAHRLARATFRNVRQNLFFAFAYNTVGVAVAAGALYPAFGVALTPIAAAAAMSLSSVSVIGNALRLNRIRL